MLTTLQVDIVILIFQTTKLRFRRGCDWPRVTLLLRDGPGFEPKFTLLKMSHVEVVGMTRSWRERPCFPAGE